MRLKDGNFYTDSRTNKVYRLNEDNKGSWYLSTRDDDNDQMTRTSGRNMMKMLKSFYNKVNDS
ncbi:hypothetical protein ABIC37_000062 [Priestia megaterium]|uniref:hypothetical protein n=1 Tax=Priestia megaterium TaxID=1404 RepID=UPI00203BDD1B|nr:hypothetical protein [Priestia megaterium]MCM3194712.1 hypothetical protein [Priestia megaterium]